MVRPARKPRRLVIRHLLTSASLCVGFTAGVTWSPAAPAQTRPAAPETPAQPAAAATTQATRPATTPAFTRENPRDALKFFAAALRDGDAKRLREAVLLKDDAEERMVTAIADMSRALATLHAAAKGVYGGEAAATFTGDTAADFEQTLVRIDAAELTIDKDAAVVRYADDKDHPFELRKVGQEWKVPATQFTQGAEKAVLERRIGELSVQTRIVRDIAGEITDGKYKSAEAAGLAWRSKMMAALSGTATTSATQPGANK